MTRPSLAALLAVLATLAPPATPQAPDVERDRLGRAVRDEHRQPLVYGPDETAADLETRPAARARPLAEPVSETGRAEPFEAADERPSTWSMRPLWWRHVYGTAVGESGLAVTDLDGDGQAEIVAGSSSNGGFWENDSWIVARRSATPGSYDLVFRSPASAVAVTVLRVAQLDADPTPEVVTATGSQVLVYDGSTRALQQAVPTAASAINGLVVADSDGDGDREYVLCSATSLYVYDLSGALAWSTAVPCQDLAVGQVDLDAAPEVVIGDGDNPGYVIDGQTHALEWTNSFGFGIHVRLGDVDADGRQEVVAGFAWQAIRLFDAELQSLKASVVTELDVAALQLIDVEGDGPLEIVYGDGQWGEVHVLDSATLLQKWQVANPEHGVTDVALGDPDGDGVKELVWGAGHTSTGPDHLYVASAVSHSIEWQSLDINGPFLALDVARVVGTARRAVLGASFESDSGYGDGLYFFHYAATGAPFYQSPELTGLNWTGMTRLRSAQLDADSQAEVLVATSSTYTGYLMCLDSLTHELQWQATLPDGLTVAGLALGDVDADGALEAVVGVEVQHTGAPGVYVYVFDAATGAPEWQSPSLAGGFVGLHWLRVAQLDATDPQLEIAVGATNGQVYVIDRVLPATVSLGAQAVSALETFDVDGNGVAELFVGTSAGAVRRIHPATGAVLATPFSEAARVDALAIGDLDGDGIADYATASGNVVRVRSGVGAALLWASAPLGGSGSVVGDRDSLLLAQVDGLAQPELVVNFGGGFVVLTSAP